jgi:hypothetical protein
MLDPEQVDLADLTLALEDHSEDHSWWLDPDTGEVEPRFAPGLGDDRVGEEADRKRLIRVTPFPPSVGYGDMEDFIAQVRDPRVRYVLEQAISGRGAFRRFKDALLDFPELRSAWFAFHDARGERRAIEWLAERALVAPDDAQQAMARRPDPGQTELPGLLDVHGLARRVALDLRRMYRDRLRRVLLLGAWARGDAHPESEVELVVVLDRVPDRWEEKRRMDRVMWRHSIRHDTVVTEIPVAEADFEHAVSPLLVRARAEGVRVE